MRYLPLILLLVLGNACHSQHGNAVKPPPPPPAISKTGDTLLPAPQGFVTDIAGIFTAAEKAQLETMLHDYRQRTTNQIAVVTLPENITADEMAQYAKDLHNYWGIGQKDKNNGVLIALSVHHRNVRISTGRGIEEQLTNEEAKRIIETLMTPRCREGRYFEGIRDGAEAVMKALGEGGGS